MDGTLRERPKIGEGRAEDDLIVLHAEEETKHCSPSPMEARDDEGGSKALEITRRSLVFSVSPLREEKENPSLGCGCVVK